MGQQIKPRLAKGTRDFSPADMNLRNYIFKTITGHFDRFGFEQIETPAIENLETLTGKYGDEGDQLIFKILNSGDYLSKADEDLLREKNSSALIPSISEKALKYDLTVPFARYVVLHRNEITFPFRRYQIQPVWRADRPQKGRYREFYQCDADVIGSNSLLLEVEFINLIHNVFKDLNISVKIKLNSRKILFGFCQAIGIENDFTSFTTILDKLDKKPWSELEGDFADAGFTADQIKSAKKLASVNGIELTEKSVARLSEEIPLTEIGEKGVEELKTIARYLGSSHAEVVELDLSLARGLNYYTGAIIEVKADKVDIGSVCGGGRYDDLTGIFGLPDTSGIGISFGIDRIYDILRSREESLQQTRPGKHVVFVNFGENEVKYSIDAVNSLRQAGVRSELYPDADKLKKQFKYADQKGASHVVTAGEAEIEKKEYRVKDLKTGEQWELSFDKMKNLLLKD
ncbi:MAG TPA: histidine--tRNA ligase [Flavobacteriales bacterium]|nr:histidine--tRNA ligase [Flavobacteriales bacterium]